MIALAQRTTAIPAIAAPVVRREREHLPALDGVRGMAVIMVLIFHYHQGMLPISNHWISWPVRLLDIGQSGVDLFFVLSGFLITGILLEAKGTTHFLRNFYVRRALRILPLYYLTIAGCLLAGWLWSIPHYNFDRTWWYLVYLQNLGETFWPAMINGPAHFWSLGVEEHFYLVWPFLILLCDERTLPRVLLFLIVGSVICRLILLSRNYDVFYFSPCRLDALSAGALLAVLQRRAESVEALYRACRLILIGIGPLLMILYCATSGHALFVMQIIKYLLIAILYTALLGVAALRGRGGALAKAFSTSWLRWCGKYSYAMYVFHPFVYRGVMGVMRTWQRGWMRGSPGSFMSAECFVCVALSLAVGWMSWQLFERHFLDMKKLFS